MIGNIYILYILVEFLSIYIYIYIPANPSQTLRAPFREEQCRAMKGGQTTQKANIYLGDFCTTQPEQVSHFPL